jgi:hypothetical protein
MSTSNCNTKKWESKDSLKQRIVRLEKANLRLKEQRDELLLTMISITSSGEAAIAFIGRGKWRI